MRPSSVLVMVIETAGDPREEIYDAVYLMRFPTCDRIEIVLRELLRLVFGFLQEILCGGGQFLRRDIVVQFLGDVHHFVGGFSGGALTQRFIHADVFQEFFCFFCCYFVFLL